MKILLFNKFHAQFPSAFISFLEEHFPHLCSSNVRDEIDFNRWDISVRSDNRLEHAIKLYEKSHGSLSDIIRFNQIRTKDKGFIVLDTETGKEDWELVKKPDSKK